MVLSDGFRARTYDLEDAYVWVTKADTSFARMNVQIRQQDWMQPLEGVEVIQDGAAVFTSSTESGWQRLDAAELTREDLAIPKDAVAEVGGGTFAVRDSEGGVWVAPVADAATISIDGDAGGAGRGEADQAKGEADEAKGEGGKAAKDRNDATYDAGRDAVIAVGRSGVVAVLKGDLSKLVTLSRNGGEPRVVEIDGEVASAETVQVSLVGAKPVALVGDTLVLPDGSTTTVEGGGAQLQLPGEDAGGVLVATEDDLLEFPLGGGEPVSVVGDAKFDSPAGDGGDGDGGDAGGEAAGVLGTAVRPARVAGTVAGAWSGGSPKFYWRAGSDPEDTTRKTVPGASEDVLRFRINRNNLALNDLSDGSAWLVVDGKLVRSNFVDATTTTQTTIEDDADEDDPTPSLSFDPTTNKPPTAEPDDYGARPGLPTIMRPLDNDSDPDSDVLTIELDGGSVSTGGLKVELTEGAQAVQVTPGVDTEGGTFRYRAYDGNPDHDRGVSEYVTVTVTAHGADEENRPPELKSDGSAERVPHMVVGSKASADYQVLQDYVDPEGDPIYLKGAEPEDPSAGTVASRSNGKLTYTDKAGEPGETSAKVVVSDAPMLPNVAAAAKDGKVGVTVSGADVDLEPTARNDFASTLVGVPVVLDPLVNDSDPNGDALGFELTGLDHLPAAASATQNPDGTVTVVSSEPGPVNLGYELTAAGKTATARIRVDVSADEARQAPTAGLDLVVLPYPGEARAAERTVDLLANDYSPSGDVLVATGLSGLGEDDPRAALLTAQLIEHRRLRVTSQATFDTPLLFSYALSDGINSTEGTIVVVSADNLTDLPPVTADDQVTVHSADVVSVAVLANDVDPEGAQLHLGPEVKPLGESLGTAWAAGSRVRFVAPEVPENESVTVDLEYTAFDGPGPNFALAKGTPARLRVRVTNPSAGNSPPAPLPVEARVLSGRQVKLTVATSGIDPDGDSVSLVGVGFKDGVPDGPKKGRITDIGVDTLTYQAFEGQSGTDTFTYQVRDVRGATALGTVRVGIAAGGANQAPQAMADRYEAAPGSPLVVDPLANDLDPDGDVVDFIEGDPFIGYQGELEPELLDLPGGARGVKLTVPDADGQSFAMSYRIVDPVGAASDAVIDVVVRSDAVGRPPIARDDVSAPVEDPAQVSIDVAVLDNDTDPDGDPSKLVLSSLTAGSKVLEEAGKPDRLQVTLADHAQVVPYMITDEQGLTAYAVVRVPPAGSSVDLPPVWNPAGECSAEVELAGAATGGKTTERGIKFDGADAPLEIALAGCGIEDPEGNPVRLDAEGSIRSVSGRLQTTVGEGGTSFTVADVDGGQRPYEDSISLLVTDAAQGEEGQKVVVEIPVNVTATTDAAVNEAPTWRAGAVVEVTQDEEPSLPTDLNELAVDLEGDELVFAAGSATGVTATIDGGVLTLRGSEELPLGEGAAVLEVTVTDGQEGHAPVPVEIGISGIKTNKAMPTLRPVASVEDATLNEPSTVNVLEGNQDPYGDGLTIAAQPVVGAGQGEVGFTPDGDVTFTPSAIGAATVSFTAIDGLDREVAGTVTYKVAAPPGPPGTPEAIDFTYDSVTLKWGQAEANNSPIERYEVVASPGGQAASCGTDLSCTVEGLTPGTPYTFVVTAYNEKGEGEPSPSSAATTPDECPKAPTDVVLEFTADTNPSEGGQLDARWTTPLNNGTQITGYEIAVTPGGKIETPGPGATSHTITGLTNGQAHNITIRAKNGCEDQWGEEAIAGPAIPAGVPDAPTGVVASVISDPVGGRVRLEWTPPSTSGSPSNNGDEVAAYTIKESSSRRATETIQASQVTSNGARVSLELSVDRKAANLRFTIAATNKAGTGAESGASEPVSAPSEPLPPTITDVRVSDNGTTGLDSKVRLLWSPPTDSGDGTLTGVPITQYQYALAGQTNWQPLSPDGLVQSLTNGHPYTFQIRAYNGRYWSKPSATSAQVEPYGPLSAASVSGSVPSNQPYANFSWSTPSGNGRDISSVRVTVNGAQVSTAASGSSTTPHAWSTTFTVRVVATDEAGQTATAERSFTTGAEPPPPVAGTVTVDDAILLGTWTRSATHGGAWGTQGAAPTGAVSWKPNGTRLDYVCSLPGGTYTVKYLNGNAETWSWWLRLTDNTYVRIAAVTPGTNAQMGPHC
jgi:hypothetical protein